MKDSLLYEPVLVLNAAMHPVEICSVRKAVLDVLRQIAIPIAQSNRFIRSPTIQIAAPQIIAYTRYYQIPHRKIVLNRLNILQRDQMTCAYCGKQFARNHLTVDHIIPRSRWHKIAGKNRQAHLPGKSGAQGYHAWQNVVTACRTCNIRKGNRLLSELNWKLRFRPTIPDWLAQVVISRKQAEKMGWLQYCSYNVCLLEIDAA